MSITSATLIELGGMLTIVIVASLISAPLRSRRGGENVQRSVTRRLLARVALPFTVLVLTLAARWALSIDHHIDQWFGDHPSHQAAWMLFWEALLVLGLIEGVVRVIFHLRGKTFPLPDLLANIMRAIVVVLVAFGVLKFALGIEITALLGTTALLTAVIGFALQGVLGNLLAGMSLHISGSAMPGDWIDIGDAEGRVMQTNWRETRLRSVDGHMLIVPNSKVAAAVMHNMVRPTPLRRHKIDVGASYSDPPDDVYAALLAAAQEMPEVQKHPAPEVIVTAFEDYGINYQLRYWTNRYPQRRSIDGRVRRLIWYKFKRAGIEIPFPMSDKLLNDFMQVIYHQRKLRAEDDELSQRVADLMVSKLHNEICVNEQNQPLLARENWERIVERVDRQLYTQDETLYRQGEAGDSFHVIVSGTLKVSVAHEGDKPALEFNLESGDVVGEMSLITGLPRSATIHTATGCELLEFDRGDFRELLALHEQIPDALANLAEQREDANRTAFEALPPESQQQVVIDKAGILNRLRRMIGM